jgi:hypothetical protein
MTNAHAPADGPQPAALLKAWRSMLNDMPLMEFNAVLFGGALFAIGLMTSSTVLFAVLVVFAVAWLYGYRRNFRD